MKRFFWLVLALAGPLFFSAQAHEAEPEPATRVLVQNKYFPKPGQEDAVLATRLEASAVRKKLGLEVGVVLLRRSEADGSALVIWECEYPSIEARQADAAKAEGSAAFKAVQSKMRPLTEKFERHTWQIISP